MNKKTPYIITIVILSVIAVLSTSYLVQKISHDNNIHELTLNHTYFKLKDISNDLDTIINDVELNTAISDDLSEEFNYLENRLLQLDTALYNYSLNFKEANYPPIYSFDFIASFSIYGTSEINSVPYNGILYDNSVSDSELQFLITLKDDIDILISDMASPENPIAENSNLTTEQFSDIINSFLDKWSADNEDNHYILLSK